MADYKMDFKLKQESVLIHFQHSQEGATLRASEVKPKLDRFLIAKYESNNPDKHIPDKWRNAKSPNALNYKMRFLAKDVSIVDLTTEGYEIFYAQSSSGVLATGLKMTIICFDQGLRTIIKDNLQEFFVTHNFGMMQNKGFGSFIVDDDRKIDEKDEDIVRWLKNMAGAPHCYKFEKGNRPFTRIKTVYQYMKSGINLSWAHVPSYERSLLFDYMNNKGIGNEKAYLKDNGFAPKVGSHTHHSHPGHPHYYVRALLGIGAQMSFLNDINNRGNKTIVKISSTAQDKIERLESCIFFKVLGKYIYMVGRRINEKIYDAEFEFSSSQADGCDVSPNAAYGFTTGYWTGYPSPKRLRVPKAAEISGKDPSDESTDFIDDFLEYCCKEMNSKHGIGCTKIQQFSEMKGVVICEICEK